MVIATWNVNSIRARLEHVLRYLERRPVDVLCLQELKVQDGDFPVDAFLEAGYIPHTAGQKTYNGVAVIAREQPWDPVAGLAHLTPEHPLNGQKRLLAATVGDVRVISAYVPNGETVNSEKYGYKLAWMEELGLYLERILSEFRRVCFVGDFNVAPENRDVHDPAAWTDSVLCSGAERSALAAIKELGLTDCYRLHHADAGGYTWWDYRGGAFWKNRGLRIDHVWASPALAAACTECKVDLSPRKWKRPSDHAPVRATFET